MRPIRTAPVLLLLACGLASGCEPTGERAAQREPTSRGTDPSASTPTPPSPHALEKALPQNIIVFIGDGMGQAQIYLAGQLNALSQPGSPPPITARSPLHRLLNFEQLPALGKQLTHSASELVTDSAAAATALACGQRTRNGFLGILPDGTTRTESVAELARDKGMRVGLVTSVSLDHATPAGYYAHQSSRYQYPEIAKDLARSAFHFFGGGGLKAAEGESLSAPAWEALRKVGFEIAEGPEAIAALPPPSAGSRSYALHRPLAAEAALPYASERGEKELRLADYTRHALRALEGPTGFFLMVEGGRIDWAGHDNDAVTVAREVLELDAAVAVALGFLDKHSSNTLVVVTADHETGGLSQAVALGDLLEPIHALSLQRHSVREFAQKWQTRRTSAPPPKFEEFLERAREQWNLEVPDANRPTLRHAARGSWTEAELSRLRQAFEDEKTNASSDRAEGAKPSLPDVARELFLRRNGVSYACRGHTAAPVPIYAAGVGSEQFNTTLYNAEIGQQLVDIVRSLPALR